MNDPRPAAPPAPSSPQGRALSSAPAQAIRVSSTQLFAGAIEVQIDHHGAVYRLKKTSLGKLILTK